MVFVEDRLVHYFVYQLWSDEWYLYAPPIHDAIIGDRLVIEAGTDLDSLHVRWGQVIPSALARQDEQTNFLPFSVYRIIEKSQDDIHA